jgi:hypothetical protein
VVFWLELLIEVESVESVEVGVVDEDAVLREVSTPPYIHPGEQVRPCEIRNSRYIASSPAVYKQQLSQKTGSAVINTGIVNADVQLQRHFQLQMLNMDASRLRQASLRCPFVPTSPLLRIMRFPGP